MDRRSAISSGNTNVTNKEPVRIGKRKRERVLKSLDWVKTVARDPLNLESTWQKNKIMLRVRQTSLVDLWLDDEYPCKSIPVGIAHQAEIPEWSENAYESDTKWLGTRVWPQETSVQNCDMRVPIGFGRLDQCGCELCVRFHVSEERKRLKLELGLSFYQWHIDKMGVEVASSWTEAEETMFEAIIIRSNPPSAGKKKKKKEDLTFCIWDEIRKFLPFLKREQLVSYYFNVYLLRRRGQQNRNTPMEISSDDDQ